MLSKRKKKYIKLTRRIRCWWYRMNLKNKTVTILSNNCWGTFMYKYCNLEFNSPFIGLFVFAPDYIKLLEEPSLIYSDLCFIERSRSKSLEFLDDKEYPIGLIANDIEIHFIHYKDEDEAYAKWSRRVKRINWDNLIVKFCDRDQCTEDLIRRFDKLPYSHKVCFTAKEYPDIQSVCYLKEYKGDQFVDNCWLVSNSHWSFVKHANSILLGKNPH